jgi:hypothetical protein
MAIDSTLAMSEPSSKKASANAVTKLTRVKKLQQEKKATKRAKNEATTTLIASIPTKLDP